MTLHASPLRIRSIILPALAVLLCLAGCATTEPVVLPTILEDDWATISIAGTRSGYVHTLVRRTAEPQPEIVTTEFSETHISRLGFNLNMRTTTEYRETPEGTLLGANTVTVGAGSDMDVRAEVRGDKLVVTSRLDSSAQTKELPWDGQALGPHGQTARLIAAGMAPGTQIAFKAYVPELQRIAHTAVTIEGPDTLSLGGKTQTVRKGKMEQDVLPGVVTQVWLDDKGNVVRSVTALLGGVETLRATREEALRAVAPQNTADIMNRFMIAANMEIPEPAKVTEAAYRITLPAEASGLQIDDRRQSIVEQDANGILLRVRALADAAEPSAQKPGPECLAPSPYIQSEDPEIKRLAREATIGAKDAREKARMLEGWVYRTVTKKDYSIGFASAKEVALSREGDCTEHSVLLAALLRAEGIPARVAVGVVYWKGKFAYHMWTEAFLNDWTALDATLHENTVDATHIRFTVTALNNASAADPFLALVPVIGNVKIRIEEITTGM